MLQQPLYSLFIRIIPEAFFVVLSICLLTNSKINYKNIATAAVIAGTCVYLTRLLPIHFGVHTVLGVVIYYLLAYKFNNIKMNKVLLGTMVSTILLFISDALLVAIYKNIFDLPVELLMGKTLYSLVITLPSLIIFYFLVRIVVYFKGKNYESRKN